MTDKELTHLYFEWLYQLVCDDRYGGDKASYRRLLSYLFTQEYIPNPRMIHDDARAANGIDLRYEFGYLKHIDSRTIASLLDVTPCSMLEMIVALAFDIEAIAADAEVGNRVGQWVWEMLKNLGLAGMNDRYFNEPLTRRILKEFMNNDYAKNGDGGLFILRTLSPNEDIRTKDIWWQACHYMNENGI